jgi:hypothetical protein
MNAIAMISYRLRAGASGVIVETGTVVRGQADAQAWQRRLEPLLRRGTPRSRAHLDFGQQSAFIRWQARARQQTALALVGASDQLTLTYALELADPGATGPGLAGGQLPPADGKPGPRHDALGARARERESIAPLIPALAHALRDERRVVVPWNGPGPPDAVMWGLAAILAMIGDSRPISFVTYDAASGWDGDLPGLLVSFRPDAAPVPPDQGFAALAADLAGRFARDPAGLRRVLAEHGVPSAADARVRRSLLLTLPPDGPPVTAYQEGPATSHGGPVTVTARHAPPAPATPPAPAPAAPGQALGAPLMCPMCLGDIPDWASLDYWRWDPDRTDYEKIDIPRDASPVQRVRYQHGAYVRCPWSKDESAHYLPAQYGRYGKPVLLGFVGLTQSGKTHLLTAMIGEVSRLRDYQISFKALDPAIHNRFMDGSVRPLLMENKVLPGTPDDATTVLADAFIVQHDDNPERVVALFDVSGGDLAQRNKMMREFLYIADGLFFVIDPEHITASRVGDDTFSNVLDVVRDVTRENARHDPVSAAVVLNKADKARFEEPIARWLGAGEGTLDPADFLRESADVYAYLDARGALALTEPYQVCQKATLHVASPTGGTQDGEDKTSKYPRGVTPLRVLRPLIAMLAMTGVLTGAQAEQIGA